MISREQAKVFVAAGASHLDRVRPNWFHDVDPGTLTLHDPCGCIVGQLVGNYNEDADLKTLGLNRLACAALGFTPQTGMWNDIDTWEMACGVLQDAWIEVIADRRLRSESATATNAVDPVVGVTTD